MKSVPTVTVVLWTGVHISDIGKRIFCWKVFYTDLRHVFVLEDIGKDDNGDKIKERRNGSGARVYGVNLDAKLAHGKEAQFQLGFTAQRSRYMDAEVWTKVMVKN